MILLVLFCLNLTNLAMSACSDSEFIGCVIKLKSRGAPFGRNMMKVVFDVETEAKLLHTCKVYSSALPCFSEKINVCGDAKQKRLMKEVESIFMFLCSPFSLQRQSVFLEHRECISSTMNKAQKKAKCDLTAVENGENVTKCKQNCMLSGQADIVCMVNSWVSEQNVCTLNEIQESCGRDATDFYKSIQQYVFDPKFPIVCEESISIGSNKTSTNKETLKKNEKKIRMKNKKYKKSQTTENVVSTTETAMNSSSQAYHIPMKKDDQDENQTFNIVKYGAKPVEATYNIYNSLRAVLQANMSPQIVDMLKKTSDTLNIENKNVDYLSKQLVNMSYVSPAPTPSSLPNLDQLLNATDLVTTTIASYLTESNMISTGDSIEKNNPSTSTIMKLTSLIKPKVSMSKWRPWYLDGN